LQLPLVLPSEHEETWARRCRDQARTRQTATTAAITTTNAPANADGR
jgi:hypothetical protein